MKKLFFVAFSFMLVACSSESETVINQANMEEKEVEDEELFQLVTEGKEILPIEKLEAESLYQFKGESLGQSYTVYFYAENETIEKLDGSSFYGNEGDSIVNGDYAFYIGLEDEEVAYEQSHLEKIPYSINKEMDLYDVTELADTTLFTIFHHEGPRIVIPNSYILKDGELHEVDVENEVGIVYRPEFKKVKDNIIQGVRYTIDEEVGWQFITIEIDVDTLEASQIDSVEFGSYSEEVLDRSYGGEQYEFWIQDEDRYVAYNINDKKWILDETILEKAQEGKLGDIPIVLESNMEDVYKEFKGIYYEENMLETSRMNERLVHYGDFVLSYEVVDELQNVSDLEQRYKGKVNTIQIPEEDAELTRDEVIDLLGQPDEELMVSYYPKERKVFRYYVSDNWMLEFVILPERDGKVQWGIKVIK